MQSFQISQINGTFYSLLYIYPNEREDILTFSKKVYIYDNTKKWGIMFDQATELLLIGIDLSVKNIFKTHFSDNSFMEECRYKSIESTVRNNFAFSNSDMKSIITKLKQNYRNF